MALSTSGMKVTRLDDAVLPKENRGVDTEDIEVQIHSRKEISSSDQSGTQTTKSHKKAQSLGHFKLPGFLSTKEHIELQPIDGSTSTSSSDAPRVVLSEINVPSEKPDGVEVLATSFSESDVFDHKF